MEFGFESQGGCFGLEPRGDRFINFHRIKLGFVLSMWRHRGKISILSWSSDICILLTNYEDKSQKLHMYKRWIKCFIAILSSEEPIEHRRLVSRLTGWTLIFFSWWKRIYLVDSSIRAVSPRHEFSLQEELWKTNLLLAEFRIIANSNCRSKM